MDATDEADTKQWLLWHITLPSRTGSGFPKNHESATKWKCGNHLPVFQPISGNYYIPAR